jgi:hypothetical protein
MKKSALFLMSLVGLMVVFTGSIWAETASQYRNQNQNRNQTQNRRQKQNLSCQNVLVNDLGTVTGSVAECNYDGLTITDVDGAQTVVYGLGPASYWESAGLSKPVTGQKVTVTYRFVTTIEKNILFSLTYSDGDEVGETINLRSEDTGCPLWR